MQKQYYLVWNEICKGILPGKFSQIRPNRVPKGFGLQSEVENERLKRWRHDLIYFLCWILFTGWLDVTSVTLLEIVTLQATINRSSTN